jgi:hypothetical protein
VQTQGKSKQDSLTTTRYIKNMNCCKNTNFAMVPNLGAAKGKQLLVLQQQQCPGESWGIVIFGPYTGISG